VQIFVDDIKEQMSLLPARFTCDAEGISPLIRWSGAPEATKSFALTFIDPDAVGGTYIHWLICDIPAYVDSISEGGPLPEGAVAVRNTSGRTTYISPCPPSGKHRYIFTVYALGVEKLIGVRMDNFVSLAEKESLDKAEFISLYQRR
jgi:hypothetical protein